MHITPYTTHKIHAGEGISEGISEAIEGILKQYLPPLKDKHVLVITSKIIALCENRVAPLTASKADLIKQEADAYIPSGDFILTIKDNVLLPSAGIDESNAESMYVLHPQDAYRSAHHIWQFCRQHYNIKDLGVLVTDSRLTPMRRGVTGVGLGFWGFEPVYSYIGQPDCFGRTLRVSEINNVDALAAAAIFVMGEGAEQTPLAIIEDAPHLVFSDAAWSSADITIDQDKDIFAPIFLAVPWEGDV